jgi:putative ABC transport system permease protein
LTFYDRVVSAVGTLPGVQSAAYGSTLPFTSIGNTTWFQLEGITLDPSDPADALRRVGTSDYLKTLGARLVEGRLFNDGDAGDAPRVVVINETMARTYWPRATPIGHRVRFGPSEPFSTIVGVIQDVRERGYELAMKPAIYLSVAQHPEGSIEYLVVRVTRDPMSIVRAVRQEIARIDRDQPIATIRTLDQIVDLDIADRHQQMSLLVGFAGLALFLAAIGLYGVLSYAVVRRRRELALRLALGASPTSVMNMVIGRGLALIAIGCVAGLAIAWAGTRAMQALLYGVSPSDPSTTVGVLALVAAIAVIAIVFPAVRAARVDPLVALRYE